MRPGTLHVELGVPERRGDRIVVRTRRGEAGCVVFGPYVTLAPGRYAVDFHIEAEPLLFRSGAVCARVDVWSGDATLARAPVRPAQVAAGQPFTLPFTLEVEAVVEFRVYSTGSAALTIDYDRPVRFLHDDATDFSPVASRDSALSSPFFMAAFATFREMHARGFRFQPGPDHVETSFGDIRFHVRSREDLQVMGEVFLLREYAVDTPRPMLFVDIGMNIGLTSLAMAARPEVREVHSFEPFAEPFGRSSTHLGLNPALAEKITANPFGLGDADLVREVRVLENQTISTSVRGHDFGKPETIAIRDAAPVIGELAARARDEGLDLVLKVDCEGSEFPIFATLERAGLFPAVTALAVEWHKWWSPGSTQAELIAPLKRAGFVVIDRTVEADPYAGLFYAVRGAALS